MRSFSQKTTMRFYHNNMNKFIFGSFIYYYDLIREDRKTLGLTVKPDLGIVLKCPHGAESERIEHFLRKKWFWLEKQLSYFKKYQRRKYQKEYVSGEGFLYLGRQYKLVVKKSSEDSVKMAKGLLTVFTTKGVENRKHVKRLVDAWYSEKIEQIFNERYEQIKMRFRYRDAPKLAIRDMQKRWGSYLVSNTIVLNPRLIHTPKDCIDYVLTHEMCHIKHSNHDKIFYKYLKRQYPKWEIIKDKLEAIGVHTR